VKVLDEAMRTIKRRAHKIIWMNPLAGSAKYEPICAGMRTAWPYIDYFLPANNIDSSFAWARRSTNWREPSNGETAQVSRLPSPDGEGRFIPNDRGGDR